LDLYFCIVIENSHIKLFQHALRHKANLGLLTLTNAKLEFLVFS